MSLFLVIVPDDEAMVIEYVGCDSLEIFVAVELSLETDDEVADALLVVEDDPHLLWLDEVIELPSEPQEQRISGRAIASRTFCFFM